MKRALGILLMLCMPIATYAQESITDPHLFIRGGISKLFEPDEMQGTFNLGYSIGGSVGFDAEGGTVFRIGADYGHMGLNTSQLLQDAGVDNRQTVIDGADYRMLSISGEALAGYGRAAQAAPYFIFGIGYYRGKVTHATISSYGYSTSMTGANDSGVGLNLGLGPRAASSERMDMYVEGRGVVGVLKDTQIIIPVTAGIRLH